MKKLISILFIFFTTQSYALSIDKHDCITDLAKNKVVYNAVEVQQLQKGGLSEQQFHDSIDRVESIYVPLLKKMGKKLKIRRVWENISSTTPSISQEGGLWTITAFGAIARHPTISHNSFINILCHELGHHLGGAKKKSDWKSWFSVEGQADYYSTAKCMRKIFTTEENNEYLRSITTIDKYAKELCDNQFQGNKNRLANCYRSAVSGEEIALLLQSVKKESVTPKFETPDLSVVRKTLTNYPATQCRLDTLLNGALCDVKHDIGTDDVDPTIGVCNRHQSTYDLGARPLCWYKPQANL